MKTVRSMLSLVALAATVLGCNSGTDDDGMLVEPPALPANTLRIFTPVYQIPPSRELFTCMTLPLDNTDTIFVSNSLGWQVGGGHHVMILTVDENADVMAEPHECIPEDMAIPSMRFVGVGTAAGDGIALPSNMALQIEPHRKLLLQTHYINTTGAPMAAQDAIDLTVVERSSFEYIAGAFTEVDASFELAPHATTTRVVDCSPPVEMNVPWMFAHMHEWGAHAKVEVVRGGATETVYDEDWDPAYRDRFPLVSFDPPMVLGPTDHIITTCTWDNSDGTSILFPTEMCATFMTFYPSDGRLIACNENGEITIGGEGLPGSF